MKQVTTIKLPMYSCELVFGVTDNIDNEAIKLYKKCKIEEKYVPGTEGIFINNDIDKYYLLINTLYLTHNTIAHELHHAVIRMTRDRGILDEEAQAWLSGHITGIVYKFLNKKKLEVKHGR